MKTTIVFLLFVILAGCSNDNDTEYFDKNVPYYKFTNSDSNYLIDSFNTIDEVISYKNQSNQILKYKVMSKKIEKAEERTGSFSGGNLLNYYYEIQRTELLSVDYPYEHAILRMDVKKNSSTVVIGGFNFHLWNGYENEVNFNLLSSSTTSLTINSIIYNKVIVVESKNNYAFPNDYYPKKVNKVFYDINKGIIGFDDLDNNQWRIQN